MVAKSLGISIVDDSTKTVRCPICTGCNCEIHQDLQLGGWRWFCTNRRKSLPSVQLYQELKELQNPKAAFSEFAKEHKILRPMNLDALVADYTAGLELAEFTDNTWNSAAKFSVTNLDGRITETLERLGLWYASAGRYPVACGMLLGHLSGKKGKLLMKGLMPLKGLSARVNLNSVLVMPFESSPGQICSFVLLDQFERCVHRNLFGNSSECGLLGLRYVNNRENLFVVLDPLLYIFLQSQQILLHNVPLNMVCASNKSLKLFECETHDTWKNISAPRVIFWDYGRSPDAINHARKLGDRGYIALDPSRIAPTEGVVKYALKGEVPLRPERLEKGAVHWAEAIKTWLLGIGSAEQSLFLNSLNPRLDDAEMEEISKYCTPFEWQKIKSMFNEDSSVKGFTYNSNKYVIAVGKGLHKLDPVTGERELITDVNMDIQAQGIINSKLYLRGQLELYGNKIDFCEKDETLRSSIKQWLTVKCGQRFGLPVFDQVSDKNLLNLYKLGSSPKTVISANRFGYQDGMNWELPGVRVESGEIKPHQDAEFFDFCAGNGLSKWMTMESAKANSRLTMHGFQRISADPYYVASAVILHNLLAPRVGARQLGLFMCGDPDPAMHIAQDARLLQFRFTDGNESKEYTRLRELEESSDIPVVVTNLRPGAALTRWATLRSHNSIVVGGTDEMFKFMGHPDWLVVRVPHKHEEMRDWSPSRMILPRLAEWKPGAVPPEKLFEWCLGKIWEGDTYVGIRDLNTEVFQPPLHERMFFQALWALGQGLISVPPRPQKNEPVYRSSGAYIIQTYMLQGILNKVGAITSDPLDVQQSAAMAKWKTGSDWYELPAELVYVLTAKFKRYNLGFMPTET